MQHESKDAVNAIDRAMADITMDFTHIPTVFDPKDKQNGICMKFKVSVKFRGRQIHETDYSMGYGALPGYQKLKSKLSPHMLGMNLVLFDAMSELYRTGKYPSAHRTSLGITDVVPDPKDVMHCLILDASALDHANYESWADDYGYDPDSIKGSKVYQACLNCGLALRAHLGEARMAELREAFQDY